MGELLHQLLIPQSEKRTSEQVLPRSRMVGSEELEKGVIQETKG